jgi:hypothetical protein
VSRHRKESEYVVDLTKSSATVLRRWTFSPLERTGLGGTAVLLLALSLVSMPSVSANSPEVDADAVFVPCCFLLGGLGLMCFTVRAAIALTSDSILVRNLIGWHRIPLRRVTSIEPGHYGTTILYSPGKIWLALAVQKSNLSQWLNRRTRADDIADTLLLAVEAARKD